MVLAFSKNKLLTTFPQVASRKGYGSIKGSLMESERSFIEHSLSPLADGPEGQALEPDCPVALSPVDSDIEAQLTQDETDPLENSEDNEWKLNPRIISDAIIGLSDGLTVPFALTAGLSGLGDTRVVVLGGLAELIAGAISMGLGGFIGAKSEA